MNPACSATVTCGDLITVDRLGVAAVVYNVVAVSFVQVTIVHDDILPLIHVDTFHINYETLDDNPFNNANSSCYYLLTWTIAVATIDTYDTLHIMILIVDLSMICRT